jgi:hypothetical protein
MFLKQKKNVHILSLIHCLNKKIRGKKEAEIKSTATTNSVTAFYPFHCFSLAFCCDLINERLVSLANKNIFSF